MKRIIVLLIAAAVLAAAPVMAVDPKHVKIAPNNKGDLLFFPFYYTDANGIWTKLTVVNTSTTQSTVAKVVIKSFMYSEEVRDFLLYLSPADVWTGYIVQLKDGVYLYSYDDSMIDEKGKWGALDNLIAVPLVKPEGEGDSNQLGYIHVINVATDQGKVLGSAPGIAKADIQKWYNSILSLGNGLVATRYKYPDVNSPKETNNIPANILAGWMELTLGLYNIAGLNATTLADFQNTKYIYPGKSTYLSINDSLQGEGVAGKNTLADIEAALAKNDVAMPYVNMPFQFDEFTVHMFTFPTKEYVTATETSDNITLESPYFNSFVDKFSNPEACISVTRKVYDLSEKSLTTPFSPTPKAGKFCWEVQPIFTLNFPFQEGWALYTLAEPAAGYSYADNDTIWGSRAELAYKGVPVIASMFDITLGSLFTSLRYGAWTDGKVQLTIDESAVYPISLNQMVNYQYSNIPVESWVTVE